MHNQCMNLWLLSNTAYSLVVYKLDSKAYDYE